MHVELEPATADTGNAAGRTGLQAVTAAVLTAGDALARASEISPGSGVGLRGGRYHVARGPTGYRVTLRLLRWTEDLAVSGEIEWPSREGPARATLTLEDATGLRGRIDVRWTEGPAAAIAQVRGTIDGQKVVARLAAP